MPGFGDALSKLGEVEPSWLFLGIALEFAALLCYSMLTHVALGQDSDKVRIFTLFRIQLSTRSLGSLVPGGSAASNALGFRLMTLAGANGRDAGFALATAGVGSAVVLNLILWVALIVSIPGRGVNAFYGTAAIFGVIVMLLAGGVVLGLVDHEGRAERVTRWFARKMRFDQDKAGEVAVHLGERDCSLQRRHPWVFDGAIAKGSGDAGETVKVESHDGRFLAWAAFSPSSKIRARVWSFDEAQRIDAAFFEATLSRALKARERFDIRLWKRSIDKSVFRLVE